MDIRPCRSVEDGEVTRGDLAETKGTIEAFAAVEGLDGHGRAATIRFE